jgi:ferredoxin
MKIRVAKERCQGHAMCRMRAPQVYVLDEHGYNVMDPVEVSPALEEAALQGAEACPEHAIAVIGSRGAESA